MKGKDINDLVERTHVLPSLSLEITNRCNFKCVHCFIENRQSTNSHQHLSLDQIRRVLKQAYNMNVFKITITGGEPFLHPQIIEILEEIKKYNFICYVLSNGTLINENNISVIKKCVNKMFLSNYGFSKETYESVTNVSGTYSSYSKAITLLNQYNIPYEERVILLRENEIELPQFIKSDLKIETCICGDRFDNYASAHRPSDEAIKNVYHKIINTTFCKNRNPDDYVCNVGCSSMTIKATGEVTPCNNYGVVIGHIENDTIQELWEGDILKTIKEKTKFENFEKCFTCSNKQYSLFLLPCNNYQETGDSNTPSLEACRHCRIIKKVVQDKEAKVRSK